MKSIFSLITIFLFVHFGISAQQISGTITDSLSHKPLEYVSIGILNSRIGTITDSLGNFSLNTKGDTLSKLRISMIGYQPKQFRVKNLLHHKNEIRLVESVISLPAVVIQPTHKRKVGATKANKSAGWSGWGGLRKGKGHEIGITLDLGKQPVKIQDLNVLLKRQSFEKSIYRLHIRAVKDGKISDELLKQNIIFSITEESGWAKIDLASYDIIVHGKVAVSLEWLDVAGNHPERAMKIMKRKTDAYILLKNTKHFAGVVRWGVEAKWRITPKYAPCMYLNILEQ